MAVVEGTIKLTEIKLQVIRTSNHGLDFSYTHYYYFIDCGTTANVIIIHLLG